MRHRSISVWGGLILASALTACSDSTAPTDPASGTGAPAAAIASQNIAPDAIALKSAITLAGSAKFPAATGSAVFVVRTNGQRRLEMEVDEIPSLTGRRVGFYLGGNLIGRALVDTVGHAILKRDTQFGQAVPTSVAGLPVEVRTFFGRLIASGSF